MKCYIHKRGASSVYLMVQIAIIISVAAMISIFIAKTEGITGKVVERTGITEEAGTVDITRITGTDASDGDIESLVIGLETTSEGIDLKDSVILITVGNVTASLEYRNGTTELDADNGYYTR